ncbi:hypothetical protein MHM582_2429 [Microbacterium sp. HM58-2]|nr:hypothetical protein MHM582_2429 [Microbacterium sp. HM58-2]
MNEDEFAELAAAAALHALSPEDERRYRDALADHPEWSPIAETDAETADLLAGAVAPEAPPAGIRSALLARIAETPQGAEEPPAATVQVSAPAPAGEESAARSPRHPLRILFALAACLALLVGVGFGAVALNQQLNRPASVVALDEIRAAGDAEQATVSLDGGGTATAHWSASLGTVVLVADGIPELPEGKEYELWFVRGDTPVPAGLFSAADGETSAVLDGEMHAGDVIAVTVEEAGGSPSGQPTTDPVIVIPTA